MEIGEIKRSRDQEMLLCVFGEEMSGRKMSEWESSRTKGKTVTTVGKKKLKTLENSPKQMFTVQHKRGLPSGDGGRK